MSYNEAGGVFGDNEPEKVEITFSKVDDTFLDKFNKFLERAESRRERYDLTWNGKAAAFAEAGKPLEPAKTLRPDLDESVDFDKTQNLFITGDNLETLKLLQESYLNKIDMIYIDPPYNTGHDFIYHDNFRITQGEEIDNSRDDDGNRQYAVNSKENGRYHSDWLNMMYPRLKLARNVLSERGVIFISIDNNELANLTLLCNEIFGEMNFLNAIVWKYSSGGIPESGRFSAKHDTILLYARNANSHFLNVPTEKSYSQTIPDPHTESGKRLGVHRDDVCELCGNGPGCKYRNVIMRDVWTDIGSLFRNSSEKILLSKMGVTFDSQKPINLIARMINAGCPHDGIILDFFAGSGTTAHAVMKLNAEDGGHRKFIMVQLDEKCDEKSEAYKAGYKTIDQLSRERIRRAAKQIKETDKNAADHDYGFRALYVDKSNVNDDVFATADVDRTQLQFQVNNIRNDRSPLDLLFGVLVAKGWQLDGKVEERQIGNNAVYLYDYLPGAGMVSCFDENLDSETVNQIINMHPNVAVFRESSFNKSSDKLNLMERFKNDSPETSVWVI